MYSSLPKKTLIINILDVLKRYTDENHRLSQKEIADILSREYQMAIDRKAIKRNLMGLLDCGYPIEFSERTRVNHNGGDEIICYDWYYVRDFSNAELRLLIDSLLFSKHVPRKQCMELISKLEGLSNQFFKAHMKHVYNLPEDAPENKQIFLSIEVLDEAISKGRQVSFRYNDLGLDFQLHSRQDKKGSPRLYVVNPYQMVATNGRYYLICNNDKYDMVSNYRIDRITDIQLLDTPSKPKYLVHGLENGLHLPKHMAEHIYMFAGASERVAFRAPKYIIGEVIDWFGKDVEFSDETRDDVLVHVVVNLEAMRYWALQYLPHITVTSPKELVDRLKDDLLASIQKYE